jgi:hypothetical protein
VLSYCRVAAAAVVLVLAGCAHVTNLPINQPVDDIHAGLRGGDLLRDAPGWSDEMMVGLAFSGGGMRAAAFSFGVLKELARSNVALRGRQVALIDHIDFVTGVSGGAVPAAYFGLKRRAALEDFRERFLIRNAEEELNTAFSLGNLSRAVAGGVNEDTRFRSWLDANLFEGATFSALMTERPAAHLDQRDRHLQRHALSCSARRRSARSAATSANYPIASAVAASAAGAGCFSRRSCWRPIRTAATRRSRLDREGACDPNRSPLLRAFAQGIGRYRDGTVNTSSCSMAGWSTISALGIHHRAGVLRGAVWSPDPAAGRQDPSRAVSDRGFRSGAAGRLGARARRSERRRPGQCGDRRCALRQRARQLHGVPGDDGKLAQPLWCAGAVVCHPLPCRSCAAARATAAT